MSIYHYVILALCTFGFYQIKQHQRAYDIWFYAFAYLLIDDMATLHETAGRLLSRHVIPSEFFFLSKRALGEIIYLSAIGSLLAIVLMKRFALATKEVRREFTILASLMLLFVFFGVLLDSFHEKACRDNDFACVSVGILEDGGEILVTIMVFARVKIILERCQRTRPTVPSPPLPE